MVNGIPFVKIETLATASQGRISHGRRSYAEYDRINADDVDEDGNKVREALFLNGSLITEKIFDASTDKNTPAPQAPKP